MEKIVELKNVSGGFESSLDNYGSMRDTIGNFNYQFKSGLYVLEGDCATGGWALSSILAGKEKVVEGEIWIDNKLANYLDLQQCSCYVGECVQKYKLFGLKSLSVAEQIEYGINNGLSYSKSFEEIKNKFNLSDGRINRPLKYFSGERWRASMAIGYAFGKSIYCFPWMNIKLLTSLKDCLELCIPILLKEETIIIIPTSNSEVVRSITDVNEVINMK